MLTNELKASVQQMMEALQRHESQTSAFLPNQEITIAEAERKLLGAGWHGCIGVKLWNHTHGKRAIEFSVWDGETNHESASLVDAVNLCLAAIKSKAAKPPADLADTMQANVESLMEAAPLPY